MPYEEIIQQVMYEKRIYLTTRYDPSVGQETEISSTRKRTGERGVGAGGHHVKRGNGSRLFRISVDCHAVWTLKRHETKSHSSCTSSRGVSNS